MKFLRIFKRLVLQSVVIILMTGFIVGCEDESLRQDNNESQLVGKWNSYESGTKEDGFFPGITSSLTTRYENGITFFSNGTFTCRYYDNNNGIWSQCNDPIGTYTITEKAIELIYAGPDDIRLSLQLVKLDEKNLWFSHSLFVYTEYHLEREL